MTSPELAIIGGGQLARMMTPPAIALGIKTRLLAEGDDVSAAQVIPDYVVGSHLVLADLKAAIGEAPVVTFDHEHVPSEHLEALSAAGHACRPGPHALLFAQDKLAMRRRLTELQVPCPRWAQIQSMQDVRDFGFPLVLKTARGGYDGKGVWVIREEAEAVDIIENATVELLAEELVDFSRELSAQVARSASGEVVAYPVVESRQENGVCAEVIAPAPNLDSVRGAEAAAIARSVAERLDVVGMLAVELFETGDGRILVNELAMRPHNTGHWSIDGAVTSQFENHVRAVLDLPLGSTAPVYAWSVMVNILGGTEPDLVARRRVALAAEPDVHIHLYGKEVKPGRKVGHVTASGTDLESVLDRARRSAALVKGEEN
ncbi:MAG: 5-(carboxyamino)imidazole ribonucleotide synthase [Actinomycetales bacterium]|nr:5-(carboxyamino)imidazole ribonucleotide synthase [Actinomycetales bacterium]